MRTYSLPNPNPYLSFLSLSQGAMQYELMGDYPAQSFFAVERDTGRVYIQRSLLEDSLQLSAYTVTDKTRGRKSS